MAESNDVREDDALLFEKQCGVAAVYQGANQPFESLLDLEARNPQIAGRSHDAREEIRAFLERRKPEFRGR